jgi:hypothetical protein
MGAEHQTTVHFTTAEVVATFEALRAYLAGAATAAYLCQEKIDAAHSAQKKLYVAFTTV